MRFEGPGNIQPEGESKIEAGKRAWRAIKEGHIRVMRKYLSDRIRELRRIKNLPRQASWEEIEASAPEELTEIFRDFCYKYRNTGEDMIYQAIENVVRKFSHGKPTEEINKILERLRNIISNIISSEQSIKSFGESPEEPRNE